MDRRSVVLIMSTLALSIAPALLSAQESGKFSKIDELMKKNGMMQADAQQIPSQPAVSKQDAATDADKPQLVNLPGDTIRTESFQDESPVQITPSKELEPPVSKEDVTAEPQREAAKTVVLWGSGTNGSQSSSQSGFVQQPGLRLNQKAQVNAPEVLAVRFVDIPTGTVFEFNEDVSIPASKDGVLFSGGMLTSAVEQKQADGILQLMADRATSREYPTPSDCILTSDHSNLLMKGGPRHPVKTFLDIDRLEMLKRSPSHESYQGDTPVIAKVVFKPKVSKNANDASVNLSLLCTLPASKWSTPKGYTLREMSESLGHVFVFKLANVAEI